MRITTNHLRNSALALLAALGVIMCGDYVKQKHAERRAELERAGLRPTNEFYQPESAYPAIEDATEIAPVSPRQNPLEVKNLENSVTNPNMPFADNFETNAASAKASRYLQPNHPITPDFISKVICVESEGKAEAVSPKGARGIMQVMPKTWEEQTSKIYGKSLPISYADNPKINKEVGTNYLKEIHNFLSKKLPEYKHLNTNEQQKKIAAAYNGGMNRLIRKSGDISKMPKETRNYVKLVSR